MSTENLYLLTEENWRTIEALSDVLSDAADLRKALETGLEMITTAMSQPGAALYLPRFCEHISVDWTCHNVPDSWNTCLDGSRGFLQEIAEQVMKTGQVVYSPETLDLAAAFPITTGKRIWGAILLSGKPVPPEAQALWQAILRPVARTAAIHAAASGSTSGVPSYVELMRSRNTLRAMFDSLPISIYIIDNVYQIVAVNESRAARVGEKPKQIVGRTCFEKFYGRTSPCPGCRVAETFRTAQHTERLSRTELGNDKSIEWEISTFPIFDEHNNIIQTIVIEQDVTDKRNLEANLIQSEKLAAVGELAAGVAHEINNPLTAIIANAQILAREVPPGSDLIDSVKLIETAGTRASQVIRNLLGIARKEKYEFAPVDLNETLNNAISLVQHELRGKPINLNLSLASDLPRVLAAQDQIQGVWINLILNAIDANDKDAGEISVTSRYTGKEFEVVITDNGKGISGDHLARVFEPFFTTKSVGRGTGLGLSVCMRVVKHHGGNIIVESEHGAWTRFTVILPGAP